MSDARPSGIVHHINLSALLSLLGDELTVRMFVTKFCTA